MNNDTDLSPERRPWTWGLWAAFAACVVLFVLFRARWIGHLLIWDEAMNLCTVRAFRAGASDFSSNWLWRHPPLFCLMMALLSPLKQGFAERTEVFLILVGIVNLALLFVLCRRTLGRTVAVWSVFFLAVMPGASFFDVWIKRDQPAATLGLLAILFLCSRRTLCAALCLGVAMLFKETAVFYAGAVFLLWVCGVGRERTVREFLVLSLIPLVTCGWWYAVVQPVVSADLAAEGGGGDAFGILALLKFASGGQSGWAHPWYYYLRNLWVQLGPAGVGLACLGTVVVVRHGLSGWRARGAGCGGEREGAIRAAWPGFVLLPSLVLLAAMRNKAAWTVIVLSPAWAALQAAGVSAVPGLVAWGARRRGARAGQGGGARVVVGVAYAAIACAAVLAGWRQDYGTVLRAVDAGQWRGATYSREAAEVMNERVADGERVLVTSFHYWQGLPPGHPCAVFAYYFTREAEVLVRSHTESPESLLEAIITHELDWALVSPDRTGLGELYEVFTVQNHMDPVKMERSLLFDTRELTGGGTGVRSQH